jgi:ribosomal protein L35
VVKREYTADEVAEILHRSYSDILYRIKTGKIRAIKVGRQHVVTHKEIARILAEESGKTVDNTKKHDIIGSEVIV